MFLYPIYSTTPNESALEDIENDVLSSHSTMSFFERSSSWVNILLRKVFQRHHLRFVCADLLSLLLRSSTIWDIVSLVSLGDRLSFALVVVGIQDDIIHTRASKNKGKSSKWFIFRRWCCTGTTTLQLHCHSHLIQYLGRPNQVRPLDYGWLIASATIIAFIATVHVLLSVHLLWRVHTNESNFNRFIQERNQDP
jgi:hypothetical protein